MGHQGHDHAHHGRYGNPEDLEACVGRQLDPARADWQKPVASLRAMGIRRGHTVAETLGELLPTPIKRLGVRGFGESGDSKGLYAKHGLDPAGIAASVKKFLGR